jgi:hypothetical protein
MPRSSGETALVASLRNSRRETTRPSSTYPWRSRASNPSPRSTCIEATRLRRRAIRPRRKRQGGQATGVDRRLQVFARPRTVQRRRQQERRGADHEKRDLSIIVEQGHARSDPVLPHG